MELREKWAIKVSGEFSLPVVLTTQEALGSISFTQIPQGNAPAWLKCNDWNK